MKNYNKNRIMYVDIDNKRKKTKVLPDNVYETLKSKPEVARGILYNDWLKSQEEPEPVKEDIREEDYNKMLEEMLKSTEESVKSVEERVNSAIDRQNVLYNNRFRAMGKAFMDMQKHIGKREETKVNPNGWEDSLEERVKKLEEAPEYDPKPSYKQFFKPGEMVVWHCKVMPCTYESAVLVWRAKHEL